MTLKKQKEQWIIVLATDEVITYDSKGDAEDGWDGDGDSISSGEVFAIKGKTLTPGRTYHALLPDGRDTWVFHDGYDRNFIKLPDFEDKVASLRNLIDEKQALEMSFKKTTIRENIRKFELALNS